MINIRRAENNDAKDYATILNQSWKDTYKGYVSYEHIDKEFNIDNLVKNFKEYIKDNSFELYMIEYDNEVVGILELGEPEDIYKSDMSGMGEIRTLHIKKDYHHKGIGKYANQFAIDRLKELGYKKCCCWIKKQNYNSIKFHEKMGFYKTKYDLEKTIDGAPSFVMEKDLYEEE